MKKTIPFKKQLSFKTNINEITSISLENTLHNEQNNIEGDLIISGTYKITETSRQVDEFEFKIPINIEIDEKYEQDKITIDIEDFYYEIINNNILDVNIEILLDNLVEKQKKIIQEENKEELKVEKQPQNENRCIEIEEQQIEEISFEESKEEKKQETEKKIQQQEINQKQNIQDNLTIENKKNIFDNFLNENDEYSTYYIYIVREGDTIDTILSKYNILKEKLEEYNDLNELKIGDKIIIPESQNARNQ